MVENLHHDVVLIGGDMGFGKTTALERVIDSVSSVNVVGFVQPSIYDQKQGEQVDQEKHSENSQQVKIINIEQHRKAIEIHFLTKFVKESGEKKRRIFTLATLNPDFKQDDLTLIMSENMKAKKPKQPRWIFNDEVFVQISQLLEEKLELTLSETKDKVLIVIDELGWLEMEGKGHWPLVSKLVSQHGNSNIVWMFAVRNTLLKDHSEKVKTLFMENGCTAQIHPFELFKTDSSQRIADNFDEVVSKISLIVK